jgi:hypothetical protein
MGIYRQIKNILAICEKLNCNETRIRGSARVVSQIIVDFSQFIWSISGILADEVGNVHGISDRAISKTLNGRDYRSRS